jgi:hypothetical protein
MLIEVIVGGLAGLVVVAVGIGLAGQEGRAGRDRAWREIATERRRNWEERRRIEQLHDELELCRGCPLRPPELQEERNC